MSSSPKYQICLNMIVKNESKVIGRLIETVKDVIDYYIISDTGSSDNTVEIIEQTMAKYNIPGEIHHNEWKHFAHNRQLALDYVYQNPNCKYAMIIDADEELRSEKKLVRAVLEQYQLDCYHIKRKFMGNEYYLPFLLNTTSVKWNWKGPVHNYIDLREHQGKTKHHYIEDDILYIHVNFHQGSKSHNLTSKEKYMRDVELLTKELEENPDDSRSWFYLAQSYYDAKEFEEAYEAYLRRTQMGGWEEEVFYSKYKMGCCLILLDKPYSEIVTQLLDAYEYRPTRIEPLYELIKYCREHKKYHQGYLFGKVAMEISRPKDLLFIHNNLYDYCLADQYSLCAYYSGHYQVSKDVTLKILKEKKYPPEHEERYKTNLRFSLNQLKAK